ncbi:MAG: response regulator transcription factor [Chloroflexi bacterium]|jgi:DNA-binding response OmpR family regulator|nr:response regulator transcription factor [Anaerolineaceae bacterium]NMB89831.1 response regulator transcription factor [Chloroflexota bacterium]
MSVVEDLNINIGLDLDDLETEYRQKVLVIEDEPDTALLLKQLLRSSGFNVMSAGNGQQALKKIIDHAPDLILLDLFLPGMDGWETFIYIRQMTECPVIILSALCTKEEVVKGLQRGADDYIGKPFNNAEVIERIKAVLRRSSKPREITRMVFPRIDLVIDLVAQDVVYKQQVIHLTQKEFDLLAILAKMAPNLVSYDVICNSVWGEMAIDVRSRTKYLVYLLRNKFNEVCPDTNIIVNVDRVGYKLLTGE